MFEGFFHTWDKTSFYLQRKVFYVLVGVAILFISSYYVPAFFTIAVLAIICLLLAIAIDSLLLYKTKNGMYADRFLQDRLSNGDPNKIVVEVVNHYHFKIHCELIDELPFQFQDRNWKREFSIDAGQTLNVEYFLTPVERGEYHFGDINIYGLLGKGKLIA